MSGIIIGVMLLMESLEDGINKHRKFENSNQNLNVKCESVI